MPADFRARVARPEIDVHAYSSQPERRFVLIELQKYREGERLGSGVEIETITEKGVIFSDQGTRFQVARP
jgi:general secretion pathway protein B